MDITEKYPDLLREEFVKGYDYGKCYTVSNPDKAMSEFDVAVALLAFEGNLSLVSKALKRSRTSVEGFIIRTQLLKDLTLELEAHFLDLVETLHKNAALKGDLPTQRFFLSTKGKDRGYVSRAENTGKDGAPMVVEISGKDAEL